MSDSTKQSRRILILEDEKPLLEIIVTILESRGWSCVATREGTKALEIERAAGPFDVALFDLHVGGMSGLEIARELRARHKELPIVVMSGTSEEDLTLQITAIGHASFLRKPFSIVTLESSIREAAGE